MTFVASGQTVPSALKALGAPNNPQVEVSWNRYYDYQEIGAICERLATAFPELIKFSSKY